ncbi:MAG: hypothetical protein HKL96_05815 [Phycisphaerales bacterium]|nr:hypothetical protein [Phycisphaerales bacterium]
MTADKLYFGVAILVFGIVTSLAGPLPHARALVVDHHTPGLKRRVELGPIWRDDANGFEIRPPLRAKGFGRAGLDLATFEVGIKHWGITVHLSYLKKPTQVAELLDATLAQTRHDFTHVMELQNKTFSSNGHPAGELIVKFTAISNKQPISLLRQQFMVQKTPSEYYVVTFFSPTDHAPRVIATFDAIIKTFKLLNRRQIAIERLAAVAAGKKWLHQQTAEKLLPLMAHHPRLFRVQLHHMDIGYVRLDEYKGKQDGFSGLFVSTNSRSFLPKGVILLGKAIQFWALSKQPDLKGPPVNFAEWLEESESLFPIKDKSLALAQQVRLVIDPKTHTAHYVRIPSPYPNDEVHWETELGTQQTGFYPVFNKLGQAGDRLIYRCDITVARDSDHFIPGQPNKPLHYAIGPGMPATLPPALTYLWPRLVDLQSRTRMAFLVFNSRLSRMGLEILKTHGPQTIRINDHKKLAYRVTEQLDPGITTMWVDSHGRILKLASADGSVWLPTTDTEMKQMWARQLATMH